MAFFSILVQVRDANQRILDGLLETLEAQTDSNWELVLVTHPHRSQDRILASDLVARSARVRQEVRSEELLAWSCNELLDTLGNWVGFMGQRDRLLPTTLEELRVGIESTLDPKILFTDEEAYNAAGLISLRFTKGSLNPYRLRSQEYLRDLTIIETDWLKALGGFDRMASDWPHHDLFLRTLDARGAGAFVNVPQRLFQRYRDHSQSTDDMRRKDHMVGFDLYGIRQHLARNNLKAQVQGIHGSAEIYYQHTYAPSVTVLVLLGDDAELGCRQLRQITSNPSTAYRPLEVRAFHLGSDLTTRAIYAQFCQSKGYSLKAWGGSEPALLNQEIPRVDTTLVAILKGLPINPEWLHRLVDHAQLPDVGAIGARLLSPARITQPGLLGYRFEGWDWNSRGRFNELAVLHQVSAVSPHCLLVDVQKFISMGGFVADLLQLYAMDFCLRLDQAGHANIMVPGSQVQVQETPIQAPEATAFRALWPAWSDRFGFHLSLG